MTGLHDKRVVAAAAAVLLAAAGWAAGQEGLVPNGGFEQPADGNANRPRGWTPHVSGKTSVAWAAEGARTGRRCLQMSAEPDEKWGHAWWTSDPVAVKPCMAYRVRFSFKSAGHGVPCFSLAKVKEWRLFKGDTKGQWIDHEDVVVIPPDVSSTFFSVNNYNRPGKTMWLDDVSLVELPLSQSPLTSRLEDARSAVAAIGRSVAGPPLTDDQKRDLAQMGSALADVDAAYKSLAAGKAAAGDFKRINDGLDTVEKAIGAYLLTAWPISPDDWLRGRTAPPGVTRSGELTLPAAAAQQVFGVMALIDKPLAVRAVLSPDSKAKGWKATVVLRPAHPPRGEADATAWAQANSLGTLYLPPGQARYIQARIDPPAGKLAPCTFGLHIQVLDRPADEAVFTIHVRPEEKSERKRAGLAD